MIKLVNHRALNHIVARSPGNLPTVQMSRAPQRHDRTGLRARRLHLRVMPRSWLWATRATNTRLVQRTPTEHRRVFPTTESTWRAEW